MLKGLDKLQRQLKEAQEMLQRLDGDLCTANFNPHVPASIDQAAQQVEIVIDELFGQHGYNRPLTTANQLQQPIRNANQYNLSI